jgi:hypothetical protein
METGENDFQNAIGSFSDSRSFPQSKNGANVWIHRATVVSTLLSLRFDCSGRPSIEVSAWLSAPRSVSPQIRVTLLLQFLFPRGVNAKLLEKAEPSPDWQARLEFLI